MLFYEVIWSWVKTNETCLSEKNSIYHRLSTSPSILFSFHLSSSPPKFSFCWSTTCYKSVWLSLIIIPLRHPRVCLFDPILPSWYTNIFGGREKKMKKAEIEKRKWMSLKVRDSLLKVSFVIFCPRRRDSNPRPWVNEANDLPLCLLPSLTKKKQLECFLKI